MNADRANSDLTMMMMMVMIMMMVMMMMMMMMVMGLDPVYFVCDIPESL